MAFVDVTDGSRTVTATGPISKLTMKAASTCNPGDPLGYNSGWVQADADGGHEAEFFALQAGAASQEISVTRSCTVDFGTGCTGTANGFLYTGDTAGAITSSAPTNAQIIGALVSAQVAHMAIAAPVGGATATVAAVATTALTTGTTSNALYGFTTTTQANDLIANLNSALTALRKIGVLQP